MFKNFFSQFLILVISSFFVLFGGLVAFAEEINLYNSGNRFLRLSDNNEIVLSVENGQPHYASKILLSSKIDSLYEKWNYDENTKQIVGLNDFCLGVGGQYELMLKDCSETLVNTIWHFDENGRLVGVVNVRGDFEAKCIAGQPVENRMEMKFLDCNDSSEQKYELEGTKKTLGIEEILLLNSGKAKDSVYNEITNNQDLEELEKAIWVLDISEILREEELTIFAPNDQAFEDLGEGVSEKLRNPENKELLMEILRGHIVPGLFGSKHISSMDKLIDIAGNEIDIDLENGSLVDEDGEIINKDLASRNGIVHTIDKVILPEDFSLDYIK
jgi:uncharacterized surface protein with fasciclin (FAS1) repeats